MLRDAISSYPVMHAVVLLEAAMGSVGMRGRFPAGLLFAASVALEAEAPWQTEPAVG